jgi:hypothetical protein
MDVHRLPGKGETSVARRPSAGIAVGGKASKRTLYIGCYLPASGHTSLALVDHVSFCPKVALLPAVSKASSGGSSERTGAWLVNVND